MSSDRTSPSVVFLSSLSEPAGFDSTQLQPESTSRSCLDEGHVSRASVRRHTRGRTRRGTGRSSDTERNTRGPSAQPGSGQRGSYKPTAKSSAVQLASEGTVVVPSLATNNARGAKGPCGGRSADGKGCLDLSSARRLRWRAGVVRDCRTTVHSGARRRPARLESSALSHAAATAPEFGTNRIRAAEVNSQRSIPGGHLCRTWSGPVEAFVHVRLTAREGSRDPPAHGAGVTRPPGAIAARSGRRNGTDHVDASGLRD